MKSFTYKQLCQCLADSEMSIRRNRVGNSSLRGVLHGRHDQLQYMSQHFPDKYNVYCESLLERTSKPFDSKTVLATIHELEGVTCA